MAFFMDWRWENDTLSICNFQHSAMHNACNLFMHGNPIFMYPFYDALHQRDRLTGLDGPKRGIWLERS